MDAKTTIIIRAVVVPLSFLIFILLIFALFVLKCRMDRKKDERENLNYSFAAYEQWQTPQQLDNHQWQAAQHSHNQWPMNQYSIATAQMEKPVPVAYPVQYHSQLDSRSQA